LASLLTFKISFLGEAAVGKTSIVNRYVNNVFRENYLPSLGADFVTKRFPSINNNLIVQFHIWDLAGQFEYKMFRRQYLQGTHYSIVVVDASDENTWNIEEWIKEQELYAEFPKNYLIVVNKIDLLDDMKLEGVKKNIDSLYPSVKKFYTSAKENANIDAVFDYIRDKLL